MTQTVPATAVLGPGKTGLTIGLRVLNLDGTTYAAFATTDVAETSVAGTYRKAGGVVCPDTGAYIVWGTAVLDLAETTVEAAVTTVGSVTGAVGSVTAGVTLANDAITAAKFDETTAFPLKSADTGATAVARTGADSDTLETLSDQIDGLPTDADVQTAAAAALTAYDAAKPGDAMTIARRV